MRRSSRSIEATRFSSVLSTSAWNDIADPFDRVRIGSDIRLSSSHVLTARLHAMMLPMGSRGARIAIFAVGLAAGIKVTRGLHADPDVGRWGERLGRTRLRYANLPVGGTIALLASTVVPDRSAGLVRALGLGAVAGAVGYGIFDPLPPAA
jgi:hypothetical protein